MVKRRTVDASIERRIATGFIISTDFIQEIRKTYDQDLIETKLARTVISWAMDYFTQYQKAPCGDIEAIFNSKVRNGQIDEDTAELVSDFLEDISSEYERADHFNVQYLKDECVDRFKSRSLSNLNEDIQEALTRGDTGDAENLIAKYTRVESSGPTYVDPYNDADAIRRAMEDSVEPLFEIPYEYGRFIRKQIQRGRLIGIMGREKVGKSWMLSDLAHMAVKGRCNVAYFDAGDMGEDESIVRIHTRLLGQGIVGEKKPLLVPVLDCFHNQRNDCEHTHRTCSTGIAADRRLDGSEEDDEDYSRSDLSPIEVYKENRSKKGYIPCSECLHSRRFKKDFRGAVWYEDKDLSKPLEWRKSLVAGEGFTKRAGATMRLASHPNGTINVAGISSTLDMWETFDEWVADVIIIDYADILAPEDPRQDKRDQENERWKALRRLSQQRHAFVASASQTDSRAFSKGAGATLDMSNFSEDHRKLAHANGWLGLNQTDIEKECGILRVNYIVARNQQYIIRETVKLLQCLEMGRPHIASYM